MNTKAITAGVERLHARAAATAAKTVKIKGTPWTVWWNGRGFTCTPPADSADPYPIDYNTRSQAEAIRWLRHHLSN